MLEIPDDDSVYRASQQRQLAYWVDLTRDYINRPDDNSAKNILKIFKADCWPTPLTDIDTNFMKEMLVPLDSSIGSTTNEKINKPEIVGKIVTSDPKLEDIPAQLRQVLKDYRSDTNPALGNIIKQLDRLGMIASESNLPVFKDICLFLQQDLQDLEYDGRKLSDDQYLALAEWIDDADRYINAPTDDTVILSMMNALVDHHWPSSLTRSDISVLKEIFEVTDRITNEESKPENTVLDSAASDLMEEVNTADKAHPVSPMLIDMLMEEIQRIEEYVEDVIEGIISETVSDKLRVDTFSQLTVRFKRFGKACRDGELDGLYQANEIILENIILIEKGSVITSQNQNNLIRFWPKAVKEYLSLLGKDGSGEKIVDISSSDDWIEPLIAEKTHALIDLLNAPYASAEDSKKPGQAKAFAEDISLKLPTDISANLLDSLLQELPSQTKRFSNVIHALIHSNGDSKEIEKAQRIAHT